jgi:hypothetical protein
VPRILPPELTGQVGAPGLASYNGFIETWEETAELRWPNSVIVYDRMRRTDSQVGSVMRAIRLPILKTRWHFDGDGVRPEVLAACEAEFGLSESPAAGRIPRRQGGIHLRDVLRHGLLALAYGHMPFEKVYAVGPPLPGTDADALPEYMAHLVKLDPRMPRSLTGIDVGADGTFGGIRQFIPKVRPGDDPSKPTFGFMHQVISIPSQRLVMFCHEREGADWTGSSILREAYKHWLIKDQMIRIDAQGIERQNMGVPVVEYPQDGDKATAQAIASSIRSGAEAGAAMGPGWSLKLVGVEGQTKDALPSIQYHDESVGRSALAMFLNLGHDGGLGHGSLGETFVDFFTMALNSEIHWLADTLTEGEPDAGYVGPVREFVALNFGPDEPYPVLVGDELTPESLPTAEGLAQLANAGLLTHDPALEADLRRRWGLPEAEPVAEAPVGPSGQPGDYDPSTEGDDDSIVVGGSRMSAGTQYGRMSAELARLQRRIASRSRVPTR